MLRKFIAMDGALDEHPPHLFPKLPLGVALKFKADGFASMSLLNAVADHYVRVDPRALFNVTIKCHYLLHAALMAEFVNPRLSICYSGEDYMHHMRTMVASSVHGTPAWQVSKKLYEKVSRAMHLEFRVGALVFPANPDEG